MILKSLHLQNFRNHPDLRLQFSHPVTLLLGPNGSGKTNILEAIYLLSTGKSFRADRQQEMISYSADLARVRGVVSLSSSDQLSLSGDEDDEAIPAEIATASWVSSKPHQPRNDEGGSEQTQLEILITRGQLNGQRIPPKKYLLNGVSKLQKNFVGHLPAVLFGPHDLALIDGSPSRRRTFLDLLLSQVSWEYQRNLAAYEKGLRQRNKLLLNIKEGKARPQQLLFWDQLLIKNGQLLTQLRQQFTDFLNQFSSKSPGEFSQFSVEYQPSHITQSHLSQYQARELAAGITLIGPHRDDFIVRISSSTSRNLHRYGSRGEQRLAVLWLKTGELAFIRDQTGDQPLLLLDDIFSELDHPHRQLVSQSIKTQQTIITAADEHLVEGIKANQIAL